MSDVPYKIESALADRINLPDIRRIATWAMKSKSHCDKLWNLAHSEDRRPTKHI